MNIQLTISLLVSDRMDTLKRCLDSITPLLRELQSELIIVSTGKDSAAIALAQQYTPHIIPFTWCDDFSKARNAGLKKARGEWFLFLDDDEWFEDTAEIIQFFKSGEYKRYHSATYIQRNYGDWGGRAYTDVRVGRMCRLTPGTKFIYPIHENLNPFNDPRKNFTSYVHHYGYVEKPMLKSDRNLPLLHQRFDEDPTSLTCMQIALEYYNKEDYDNALEYCHLGLKLLENKKGSGTYELWLQVHLPLLLASAGRKKDALGEGEQLLLSGQIPEVGEAHLHAILSELYTELKDYENGLKHALEFHAKIDYLEKHPEKAEQQTGGTITFATAKERAATAFISGLTCAGALDETAQMQKFLTWLPWDSEGSIRTHYHHLEDLKSKYPKHKKVILEGYYRLDTDNPYVNLQKALYAEEEHMSDQVKAWGERCAENCPEDFLYQFIGLAERSEFSVRPLMERISTEAWEKCAEDLAEHTENQDMEKHLQKLSSLMPDYPLFVSKVNQCFLKKRLLKGIVDGPQFIEFLEKYCETVCSEAGLLYNAEIFSKPYYYILPQQYKFAFAMKEVLQNLDSENYMACIPLLKNALHICPQMSVVVSRLSEYLEEIMAESQHTTSEEFMVLGRQVKQMLFGLIENRQWQAAYGIIEQLTSLLPDDLEVLRLKQEILMNL